MIDAFSDLDDTLEHIAIESASEQRRQAILVTWQQIRGDLRARGPFSRMLIDTRASARAAMKDLVYVDSDDTNRVKRLQDEVKRYVHTLTMIQEYKSMAESETFNIEELDEITEEDDEFIAKLER